MRAHMRLPFDHVTWEPLFQHARNPLTIQRRHPYRASRPTPEGPW